MTSDTRSELPIWRVGSWGDGSTPPYLANIFCDAHEATIAAGLFKEHAAAIVEAHNEALSTPPKVGSGELDAAASGIAIFGDGKLAKVYDVFRADPNTRGDHADYFKRGVADIMKPQRNTTAYAAWLAGKHHAAALAAPVDHPEVVGGTYYAKGKDAAWFEALSDSDFARESCYMAQDLNDTGLGDDLDKWMPFQAVISDAAARIERLAALQPSDSPALEAGVAEKAKRVFANPCIQKLGDDEPFFVLLGRDKHAAAATRAWAGLREAERGVSPKTTEAREIASEMDQFAALAIPVGCADGYCRWGPQDAQRVAQEALRAAREAEAGSPTRRCCSRRQ